MFRSAALLAFIGKSFICSLPILERRFVFNCRNSYVCIGRLICRCNSIGFTPHISLTDCIYFFNRHITAGSAYAFTGTPLNANIPRSTSALQMSSITGIKAREILDSRGNPTVEVRTTNTIRYRNALGSQLNLLSAIAPCVHITTCYVLQT